MQVYQFILTDSTVISIAAESYIEAAKLARECY